MATFNLEALASYLEGEARRLDRAATPQQPSARAIHAIRTVLASDTKERFEQENTPEGEPWPPFAETTRRRRGRMTSAKLLRDWGILMASAADAVQNADISLIPGGLRFDVHTGAIRGHDGSVEGDWHRLGTSRGIPAREFVGISDEAAKMIAEIVAEDQAEQALP